MTEQHGRFIDDSLGILTGEGASQVTKQPVVKEQPARECSADGPSYYDQPVLQTPVWIWTVPAYFYTGGTAGAALTLAAAAQKVDRYALRNLVRTCRWIGVAGIGLGSVLLIWDLGYKRRFLNMLRVFRPTSPLSVGSWLLASGGTLSGAAALLTDSRGLLRVAGDVAGSVAGLVGMPLAGYTGVVLANTAVPAWQESRRILPVLFIGSAMASTASLLEMLNLRPHEEAVARNFGIVGKAVELAGALAIEREASRVERVGRAFHRGRGGTLWKLAKALSALSLFVSLFPGKSKRKHQVAGVLGTAGALAIRFAILDVGKQSAADPRATFQLQRAKQAAPPQKLETPRTMTGSPG